MDIQFKFKVSNLIFFLLIYLQSYHYIYRVRSHLHSISVFPTTSMFFFFPIILNFDLLFFVNCSFGGNILPLIHVWRWSSSTYRSFIHIFIYFEHWVSSLSLFSSLNSLYLWTLEHFKTPLGHLFIGEGSLWGSCSSPRRAET